jgi:1-acyl-sn-glycerol-3-phosphate acyltransferase
VSVPQPGDDARDVAPGDRSTGHPATGDPAHGQPADDHPGGAEQRTAEPHDSNRRAGEADPTTTGDTESDTTTTASRDREATNTTETAGTTADTHAESDASAAEADSARTAPRTASPLGPAPTDPDRLSDVDEWGRSEHLRSLVRTLTDPIFEHWFRVEWQGFDKIPREGGAMLVGNHAGAIPFDASAIMHGIERDLGRPVYGLADDIFCRVPVVNVAWSRLGGVQAHPDNAYRLLREQHQLVTVFPEGADGPGKTFDERYRLRRFGRGGFVQLAMRAGVPIIPLAIVGTEETMPTLFRVPSLAKMLGIPYVPVTANLVALGPVLGFVPFPAKIIIRVLDPVHFDEPPDRPRYSRSRIMDAAEDIRHTIQTALYDMLRARRSVWTG